MKDADAARHQPTSSYSARALLFSITFVYSSIRGPENPPAMMETTNAAERMGALTRSSNDVAMVRFVKKKKKKKAISFARSFQVFSN